MAKSRKKRKKSLLIRIAVGVFGNPVVQRTLLLSGAFIVTVNLLISMLGASGASLFSPFHLWNKTQALGWYASHKVMQLTRPSSPNPKEALSIAVGKHRVPKKLVFAIARAESDFVPERISRTGAMGLMQIMPQTAKELGVSDPFDVQDNADGGAKYLAWLWKRYDGDIQRVAAAYNAGPGRIPIKGPYRAPRETQSYVRKVVRYTR